MSTITRAIALGLLALTATGLQAQTMYRCGKTFQDRPCDAGVTEQRVVPGSVRPGAAGGSSGSTTGSRFAPACSRRGEHAQRITWQRESGATMERQINEARGDREMIDLIQSVYSRRGTAPDIRSAIESECVAEKENAANAAAALANLQQQAGKPAAAETTAAPADAGAQSKPVATSTGPDPRCDSWQRRKENAESRLRAGGSAQTMESWQRERRDLERQLADAKC